MPSFLLVTWQGLLSDSRTESLTQHFDDRNYDNIMSLYCLMRLQNESKSFHAKNKSYFRKGNPSMFRSINMKIIDKRSRSIRGDIEAKKIFH